MPSPLLRLQTKRLELVAATADLLACELKDSAALGRCLNADIPVSEWPPGEYDREAAGFFLDRLQTAGEEAVGWYLWYVIATDDSWPRPTCVAATGFFGEPCEGKAEIGFSVIPSARGKGYAVEIARALADFAFRSGRVNKLYARTTSANLASLAVLRKSGFTQDGTEDETGLLRFVLAPGEKDPIS